jgi:branched-chain amino acid transport system ATP-binding protein
LALVARDVTIRFGGVLAVDAMDVMVRPGEIVGLIGPNGAGKTTFINCISGTYVPASGSVTWNDEELCGQTPSALLRKGISRTFQNVAALHDLTVLEVVKLGHAARSDGTPWASLSEFFRGSAAADARLIADVLRPLGLADVRDTPVHMLSYGNRKAVDIARALAVEPRLLLLDEPVAGVAVAEAQAIARFVKTIRDGIGCAVMMVEHKMDVVMDTCDRIVVMASGAKIFEGTPKEVQSDHEVRRVYLGQA